MNTYKIVSIITFITAVVLMYAGLTNHPTLILSSAFVLLCCSSILVYIKNKQDRMTVTIRQIDPSCVSANLLAQMQYNQMQADKQRNK